MLISWNTLITACQECDRFYATCRWDTNQFVQTPFIRFTEALNADLSSATSVYSGQEQHYSGGGDPYDREAIWLSGYSTSAPLYTYVTLLNKIRKLAIAKAPVSFPVWQAMVIYSDDHHIAIRKGDTGAQIVAVYNNFGTSVTSTYTRSLNSTYFGAGVTVMEMLSCTTVTLDSSGNLLATFNAAGSTAGLPLVSFVSIFQCDEHAFCRFFAHHFIVFL